MHTKFIEATQDVAHGLNHGKFLVGYFGVEEWTRKSVIDGAHGVQASLLGRCGWSSQHAFVFDLQTGEGAMFHPGGSASADLSKHRIWVCPMFEPFLDWFYRHVALFGYWNWWSELPTVVELPKADPAMYGYRRPGP